MKRTALVILLCVTLVLASACSAPRSEEPEVSVSQKEEPAPMSEEEANFVSDPNALYIRTSIADWIDTPFAETVSSLEELYAFYRENQINFALWHNEATYSDTTVGFIDAVEQYGEGFFEENALVLVAVGEPSGSIRHHVKRASIIDDVLNIEIDILHPGEGTDDMADWLIVAQVPKRIAKASDMQVSLSEVEYEPPLHEYEKPSDLVEFTSGGVSVEPYEEMIWLETTNTKTDETDSVDYELSSLGQLMRLAPEIEIGKGLQASEQNYRLENLVVYDEQFQEVARPKELNAGLFVKLGAGTYYASMEIRWSGEYDDVNYIGTKYKKQYSMKFVMPEKDYGMAEQLSELS